jgi:phosphofructokinase-like protein
MPKTGPIKRIGVLTGGGDCPGLNAVIRAVTKTAVYEHDLEVIGIADGFLGLIENRMRRLEASDVSNILTVGGTILGTSNKADPSRFAVGQDADGKPVFQDVTDRVLAHIDRQGLDALVCIGGDGTMGGLAHLMRQGLRCIGVPKTIDNDLMHTEITFGFRTAVETATEALDRIHTTASSHHRVMIVELMGRNAGWLALNAGVASGADVILIPEIPYDLGRVCEFCLGRSRHGKAFTIIAVSEGAKPRGGQQVINRVIADSPDPVRLGGIAHVLAEQIAQACGVEARATVLGHIQRGGSPCSFDRVLATQLGYTALKMLMAGSFGRMVAVQKAELTDVPLEEVAGKQRLVPLDYPLIAAARALRTCMGD